MESLIAAFFAKIIKFCFESLVRNLPLIGDISEACYKFTKFPVVIVSGGGDKALFCISRDHMISGSHDSVCEIPSP